MSDSFAIVRPIAITDSILTSSSVSEPATVTDADPAAWSAATAYAPGDRVTRTSVHKVYQRKVAGTTGTAPESDTTNWLEVGYTNRWRMFDSSVSTQTSNATSIVITLTPGQFADCLGFDNVDADSIRVQVASTSYDQTVTLRSRAVRSWWDYFYEPFIYKTSAVFTGLPMLVGNVITVTITKTGGTAKCGLCVLGQSRTLGGVKYGARVGITDYSVKSTDDFGNTIVSQRAYSKRMNVNLWVDSGMVDEVQRLLASYRATPVLWIGAGNLYSSLIVYGYFRTFEEVIQYPTKSMCDLEIEGLT